MLPWLAAAFVPLAPPLIPKTRLCLPLTFTFDLLKFTSQCGSGLCPLDMSPTLINLLVPESGKYYPGLLAGVFVPLAPPLNPLRFPSNSYFCPRSRLYFTLGSGTYLQGVWSAIFALLEAENSKFRPGFWIANLPYYNCRER